MSKLYDEILSTRPKSALFHYTSQVGMIGIFKTKTIWATNVFYLNDRAEFLYALELVDHNLNSRRATSAKSEFLFLDELQKSLSLFNKPFELYVASFSEEGNLLSQWRAYSGDGVGFSIGFYWSKLSDVAKIQDLTLAPCIYDYETQQALVNELVEESIAELKSKWDGSSSSIPPSSFVSKIGLLAPLLKHPSFAEEKEWRLFSKILDPGKAELNFRHSKLRLIPYAEFQLTSNNEQLHTPSIYAGPCPDPLLNVAATGQLGRAYGVKCDLITVSGIPFRSW